MNITVWIMSLQNNENSIFSPVCLFPFLKTWDTLCRRGRRSCQQRHLWRRGGIQRQDRRWVGIFNSDTFSMFQHVQSILSPRSSSIPAFELQNISMKCQIIFTFQFTVALSSLASLPRALWKRNYTTLVLASWPVSYHWLQHPRPLRAKDLDSSICNPFNWRRCFYPFQRRVFCVSLFSTLLAQESRWVSL